MAPSLTPRRTAPAAPDARVGGRVARAARRPGVVACALVALLCAVGAAGAAVGANEVASAQVRNESLTSVDIKANSLFSTDVRNGGLLGLDLKASTITTREVNERSLTVPANFVRSVAATVVADAAAGEALAEALLIARGTVQVSYTCWRQADTGVLHADVFARTTVNGALLQSPLDVRAGGTAPASFLDIGAPKNVRQIASPDAVANSHRLGAPAEFTVFAPGGDHLRGNVQAVLQNGAVAGVDAPLGTGNRCRFLGYVSAVDA